MSTTADPKPAFTPESLAAIVAKINKQFPTDLKADWRKFVSGTFALTPDQEQSLSKVPPAVAQETQAQFAEIEALIAKGGKLSATIVKLPPAKQTSLIVHELHLNIDSPAITPRLSVVIAHCDAHCRHWGWGRG